PVGDIIINPQAGTGTSSVINTRYGSSQTCSRPSGVANGPSDPGPTTTYSISRVEYYSHWINCGSGTYGYQQYWDYRVTSVPTPGTPLTTPQKIDALNGSNGTATTYDAALSPSYLSDLAKLFDQAILDSNNPAVGMPNIFHDLATADSARLKAAAAASAAAAVTTAATAATNARSLATAAVAASAANPTDAALAARAAELLAAADKAEADAAK